MATQLQIRRGTSTQVAAFTGAEGEIVVNTTNDSVHVNDGSTAGGFELARADFGNISTSATLTIATLNTTNLDLTNLEVTNLKAKDGTAAGSIADSTGVVTIASSVLTTADINGGTIDNTAIGGSTAAAGSFTTLQASTSLNVDGTVTADGLTVEPTTATGLTYAADGTNSFINFEANSVAASVQLYIGQSSGGYFSVGVKDSGGTLEQRMRVTSTGVGIGTSGDPDQNLVVESAADTQIKIVSGASNDAYLTFYNGTSLKHYFKQDNTGLFELYYYDGSSANSRIAVDTSGKVGIGTSSPSNYYANHLVVDTGSSAQSGITIVSDTNRDGMFAFADGTSGDARYRGYINYNHVEDSMVFGSAGGAGTMKIDSSGNVSIGSAAGSEKLNVADSITVDGYIYPTTDNGWSLGLSGNRWGSVFAQTVDVETQVKFTSVSYEDRGMGLDSTGFYIYNQADSRYDLVIDQSGNVLVGTTDTTLYNNTTGGGIGLMASNRLDVARSGDIVATFNRTTDDGAIVQFYDRGTLSGQIGVESAGVFLGNPLNGGGLRIGGDITAPANSNGSASNNTQDLGTSSFRWKTIYAVNALNTSDEKLKQDIEGLSDAEKRVAVALKALVKKYRFKDEVTAQGFDAKIRVGLIAQQVVSAFDDEGLTATDYALLSHETDTDAQFNELETKTYSINYSELLAFIISAI